MQLQSLPNAVAATWGEIMSYILLNTIPKTGPTLKATGQKKLRREA